MRPISRRRFGGFCHLDQEQQTPLELEDGVVEAIALGCGGDVRKSINAVEMCVLSAPVQDGGAALAWTQ